MEAKNTTVAIHPLGEGNFSFSTPGGQGRLSVTDDALTPFGGLVPWAAYTKHIGIVDKLAADESERGAGLRCAPIVHAHGADGRTALLAYRAIERRSDDS